MSRQRKNTKTLNRHQKKAFRVDKQVLRFAKLFAAPRHQKNQMDARLAGRSAYTAKGKCDFCGTNNVNIKKEYDTLIPSGNTPRPALVCQKCG